MNCESVTSQFAARKKTKISREFGERICFFFPFRMRRRSSTRITRERFRVLFLYLYGDLFY